MPAQPYAQQLNRPVGDGPALSGSTAEAIISAAPDYSFPSLSLQTGQTLLIVAGGRITTAASTPGTLTFQLRWGGLTGASLFTSGALALLASQTNNHWRMEAQVQCRAEGVSGSLFAMGILEGITAVAGVNMLPAAAPAAVASDTTIAKTLVLTGQFSSATTNALTVHHWIIQQLN